MSKLIIIQFCNLWYLFSILCAQSINLSPELTCQYESASEQYSIENLSIRDYELTIKGEYTSSKMYILAHMGYHLIDGMNGIPSDFTREQGLHWFEHSPGIADDQRNYYVANMKLQYGDSASFFYFNKWNQHWGPGINSLTISNKIPSFPHFGFKWKLHQNIHFEYFHGKLKSGITDNLYAEYESMNRPLDIVRNIAGHRLEWQPCNQIILSGSELISYANRSIETIYLLPFMPFFPIQTYVGETDNVIMSGDIQYLPNENIRMYGVVLVDEWSPPYTFDKDNRNWFGWQAGFEKKKFFLPISSLRLEYTWTDHRIYRHRFQVNDFYSYTYPVGFWAGPHAEELYLDYRFTLSKNHIKFLYSNAKRGELTDKMLEDQYNRPNNNQPIYERFSNTIERKQVLSISLTRSITERLFLNISYTYVDWKNAGNRINTETSELILKDGTDMIKHSIGFGIRYRY